MKHLDNFKKHPISIDKHINSFENYGYKTNEGFNPVGIFKSLLSKFPKLEEYWLKTLGKPKFSSTSTTKGTARSATSGLKRDAAVSRAGWGNVSTALKSFDVALKGIAVGEFSGLNKINTLLNAKNCIRSFNQKTRETDTLLSVVGSETKGIYLHELLTLLNAWKNNKMMTNDLLECVPESTIDNPTFRESFKKIIESIKRASRKVSEVVDFSTLSKNWTRNGNYDVETTLNLFLKMRNQLENKVSSLSNKSFDPSKCRINRVTETSGREILEMTIENGETILMYKSTGLAGKKLPPPGGWSVIPGFISEAKLVGSNNISLWFGKDDITIGLTHTDINGNGTNKYLSELAQYLQKNSPSKLILK